MCDFIHRFQTDAEFFLKCLAALGALIAFAIGLLQYRKAQLWKRKEFLGTEIKAFLTDPIVRNALLLIDWGSRRIPFDLKLSRNRWPRVTRDMQVHALRPHTMNASKNEIAAGKIQKYSYIEAQIRDTYDEFLNGLERLNAFVESGLFNAQELEPYMRYWFRDMTSSNEPIEDIKWRLALLAYIQFYDFVGVQHLFKNFAHDISVGGSTWQTLRKFDPILASQLEKIWSSAP